MAVGDSQVLAAICVGGAAGSMARYGIEQASPAGSDIPWATLGINCSGSLLLGILVAVVAARLTLSGSAWARLARPALGTGVLGGFTTFSTAMVEAHDRSVVLAVSYLGLSVGGGVLLAMLGLWLGERWAGPPHAGIPTDPDLP